MAGLTASVCQNCSAKPRPESPLNGHRYHGALLLSRGLLQSVRRLGSAPADPVADNTATYRQALARRDAVHCGAVSPLALQELQGVLPLRHRRSVSRLL